MAANEEILARLNPAFASGYRRTTLAEAKGLVKVWEFPFRQLAALCPQALALAAASTAPARGEAFRLGTLDVSATISARGELVVSVLRDGQPLADLRVSIQAMPNHASVGVVKTSSTDAQGEARLGTAGEYGLEEGYRLLVEVPT